MYLYIYINVCICICICVPCILYICIYYSTRERRRASRRSCSTRRRRAASSPTSLKDRTNGYPTSAYVFLRFASTYVLLRLVPRNGLFFRSVPTMLREIDFGPWPSSRERRAASSPTSLPNRTSVYPSLQAFFYNVYCESAAFGEFSKRFYAKLTSGQGRVTNLSARQNEWVPHSASF